VERDTDAVVGSGFGGPVFLLSGPPGYGLADLVTAPDREHDEAADHGAGGSARERSRARRFSSRSGIR
jgi:hypothetical protein